MPSPAVTYTFSNSTTADATQVNQNFSDVINGITDGTKDLSISAITAAGTATFNGNVNIGNASSDDLTITASLASSIAIKTASTYNVGSSTLGLLSIYFNNNSQTVRVMASGSASATWTLTLPTTSGTAGYVPYNTGSGTLSWTHGQTSTNAVSSADYTILDADGYYCILVTTGNSDRTVTLPAAANNTGRSIMIKKADTGTGKVLISGTIDGSSTAAVNELTVQYASSEVYSDGTSWFYSVRKNTGRTEGAAVAAGFIGQKISGSITTGNLVSGTPTNVSSISLTPGIWQVYAGVELANAAGTTSTSNFISISTTSATADATRISGIGTTAAGVDVWLQATSFEVVASTTTYYSVVNAVFASSTSAVTANSVFYAIRIA